MAVDGAKGGILRAGGYTLRVTRERRPTRAATRVSTTTPSGRSRVDRPDGHRASAYGQRSGMLPLVPSLAEHWALLVPLNVSVAVPPLNELTVMPDRGHMPVHAT